MCGDRGVFLVFLRVLRERDGGFELEEEAKNRGA